MIAHNELKYTQMPASMDWEQPSCRTTDQEPLLSRPSQM